MFRGKTGAAARPRASSRISRFLTTQLGVDAIQFYDHNFFDREVDMVPLLEVLARRSAAVVVLRALRCAAEPVRALLGSWCGRAGCAWPTSAPSRRATGCCTTCARARAPIRRSRRWRSAAATASCRSCPSCWHRRRTRRERPSAPSSSSATIKRAHPHTEIMLYVYTPLPPRARHQRPAPRARRLTLRDCAGAAGDVSRPPPTAGRSRSGARTGVTRTRRGFPSGCGGGSSISPPCWAAAIPTITDIRSPRGASPRCGRWRRGAIASATTVVRGSWTCRRSSSACVTPGCPVFSRAAPAAWRT